MFPLFESWPSRATPLAPLAAVARSAGALALARRLLDRSDDELRSLRGAVAREGVPTIVLSGAFEQLPWTSEAILLGQDALAPTLLWPIHLAPPCAPILLEAALRRRFEGLAAPLALVPDWKMVLPLGEALPLRREFIERWLARCAA